MTRRIAVLWLLAGPAALARMQGTARRKAVQKRLDELSPERRRQLEKRYERFRQLPPERQERARKQFRKFSEMPLDRRRAITQELSGMRGLSDAERKQRMKSEDFRNRYSPKEMEVIEEMAGLLATPK
jgi:hypothetical protein